MTQTGVRVSLALKLDVPLLASIPRPTGDPRLNLQIAASKKRTDRSASWRLTEVKPVERRGSAIPHQARDAVRECREPATGLEPSDPRFTRAVLYQLSYAGVVGS